MSSSRSFSSSSKAGSRTFSSSWARLSLCSSFWAWFSSSWAWILFSSSWALAILACLSSACLALKIWVGSFLSSSRKRLISFSFSKSLLFFSTRSFLAFSLSWLAALTFVNLDWLARSSSLAWSILATSLASDVAQCSCFRRPSFSACSSALSRIFFW